MRGATPDTQTIPRPAAPALRRVPVELLHQFLKLAEEKGYPPRILGASAAQIRDEIKRREAAR